MQIRASMLANSAEVGSDGLLYVQGGGWEYVRAAQPVWNTGGFLTGLVEFGDDELGSSHRVDLMVYDGHDEVSRGSMMIVAQRKFAPFALPFGCVVSAPGLIRVELTDSDGVVERIEVEVRLEPPPEPGTGENP